MSGPTIRGRSLRQVEALWLAGPQKEKPPGNKPWIRSALLRYHQFSTIRQNGWIRGTCKLLSPCPPYNHRISFSRAHCVTRSALSISSLRSLILEFQPCGPLLATIRKLVQPCTESASIFLTFEKQRLDTSPITLLNPTQFWPCTKSICSQSSYPRLEYAKKQPVLSRLSI